MLGGFFWDSGGVWVAIYCRTKEPLLGVPSMMGTDELSCLVLLQVLAQSYEQIEQCALCFLDLGLEFGVAYSLAVSRHRVRANL